MADAATMCEILLHAEWKASLHRKRTAAQAVVQHLGGDESIVDTHITDAVGYDTDSE